MKARNFENLKHFLFEAFRNSSEHGLILLEIVSDKFRNSFDTSE